MKIYLILAALLLLLGSHYAAHRAGKMSVANDVLKQGIERQKIITRESLRLAKRQKEIDTETLQHERTINEVKDSCADAPLPRAFADLLR